MALHDCGVPWTCPSGGEWPTGRLVLGSTALSTPTPIALALGNLNSSVSMGTLSPSTQAPRAGAQQGSWILCALFFTLLFIYLAASGFSCSCRIFIVLWDLSLWCPGLVALRHLGS